MPTLKGSKTEQSLKEAFAGESMANRRYLYFANQADIEGQIDVATLFRSTATGETGHAHGHLEQRQSQQTRQRQIRRGRICKRQKAWRHAGPSSVNFFLHRVHP